MMMKTLFVTASLACASLAHAADVTLLETPVTYHPNAGVVDSVRRECGLEDRLAERIGSDMARLNRSDRGTIAAGSDAGDAKVLRIQITHVLGVGGGAWSGPKAITVAADLLANGKIVRQTKITRATTGGAWGGFKGTCSILERSVVAIGKDLSRWVKDSSHKIVEPQMPAQGEPEKGAGDGDGGPGSSDAQ